jgi:hypothetical protein
MRKVKNTLGRGSEVATDIKLSHQCRAENVRLNDLFRNRLSYHVCLSVHRLFTVHQIHILFNTFTTLRLTS